MPDSSRQKALVAEEIARIREEERQKKMLYDRRTGGPEALRPTQDFIRDNVGAPKSEAQIQSEARAAADRRMDAEDREARRRDAVQRSMRQHNEALEERGPAQRGKTAREQHAKRRPVLSAEFRKAVAEQIREAKDRKSRAKDLGRERE